MEILVLRKMKSKGFKNLFVIIYFFSLNVVLLFPTEQRNRR